MKILAILLLTVGVGISFSQDYDSYNKQLSADQKEQAIHLEKNLMATCCFGGPIYMHGTNQKTEEAKLTIRRMLLEGKTTDEVLDYFRATIDPRTGKAYGNRILASPKASETVGKVSYWMVVGFAVIGLALLAFALKKLLTQKQKPASEESLSDETLQKIESELSNLS
ncbi:cytochrome c-type biogenesis protein CcmH [bacterium]|nr:cytochrome c-type biogenesis protein CcmH [bacterium]